jgi:hypothetical protein
MFSEVLLSLTALTFMIGIWAVMFFIFDAEVLNGYFKKKLQNRFNAEEVQ